MCDEASFMSAQMFYGVILPLLEVGYTAMVMSSSPQGPDNLYTRLTNLKDPNTGMSLCEVLVIESACMQCIKSGTEAKCTHHKIKDIPAWKRVDTRSTVQAMYGEHQDYYNQEILGLIG